MLEALSEKVCPYKLNPKPGMKMAKIDNLNLALKFLNDCGVQMELKPSAENLVDGGACCDCVALHLISFVLLQMRSRFWA